MKKSIILVFSVFLISCSSNSQKENGTIENGIYTCHLFEWKIKIPKNYTVRTLQQKQELEETGYNAIEGNTPDGITVRKNRPDLIGFGIDERNFFSSSFESLKGTKKMTLLEHQKFVAELTNNAYSEVSALEFEQNLDTEKIGKHEFYTIETKLYNAKTKELLLTQWIYNTFIGENLFSASINYTNEKVYAVLVENFKQSLTK